MSGEVRLQKRRIPDLDDDELPRNASRAKRWSWTLVIAALYVVQMAGTSIHSGLSDALQRAFDVQAELVRLGITLYLVGFIFGPMIWGPLSEIRGRKQVTVISCLLFIAFNVGCALSRNIQTFLVMRFLAGLAASSAQTNLPSIVADLWPPEQRLFPQFCYSGSAFSAPVIGPIVSGYLNLNRDPDAWRWAFWIECIAAAALLFPLQFFVPETNPERIVLAKAQSLRRKTGDDTWYAPLETTHVTIASFVTKYMTRPFRICVSEPILAYLALWLSFLFSVQYIFLEAFSVLYGDYYGFNTGQQGLAFIPIAVGVSLSIFFLYPANKSYHKRKRQLGGQTSPEARLPLMKLSVPMLLVSFFVFGWTAEYRVHWIVPMLACVPFGLAMIMAFNSGSLYMTECYDKHYLASILAGWAIARSALAAVCPLFSTQMYEALGAGWASSVLGFVVVIAAPGPYLFQRFGERQRRKSKYASKSGLETQDMHAEQHQQKT